MKQYKVYNHSRNIVGSKKPISKSPYERKSNLRSNSVSTTMNNNEVYIQDLTVGGQIKSGGTGAPIDFENDIVFNGNVTCNADFQVLSETVSTEEATTVEFAVIADTSSPGNKKVVMRKNQAETTETDALTATDTTTDTMTASTSVELGSEPVLAAAKEARKKGFTLEQTVGATTTEYVVLTANGTGRFGRNLRVGSGNFDGSPTTDQTEIADGTVTTDAVEANDATLDTMTATTSVELGSEVTLAAMKEARKQGVEFEQTVGATTVDYVALTATGTVRAGRWMRVGSGAFSGSPTADQTEIKDGTVTSDSLAVNSGTVETAPTSSTDIVNKAYVDSFHPPPLFSKITEAISPIKSDETLIAKTEILADGNYSVNAYVNIATESGNADFVCYLKHNDQKLNEAKHKFAFRGANHTNMHIFDDVPNVRVGDIISLCAINSANEGKVESGHLRVKKTH